MIEIISIDLSILVFQDKYLLSCSYLSLFSSMNVQKLIAIDDWKNAHWFIFLKREKNYIEMILWWRWERGETEVVERCRSCWRQWAGLFNILIKLDCPIRQFRSSNVVHIFIFLDWFLAKPNYYYFGLVWFIKQEPNSPRKTDNNLLIIFNIHL